MNKTPELHLVNAEEDFLLIGGYINILKKFNGLINDSLCESKYPVKKEINWEMNYVNQWCWEISDADSDKPILLTSWLFTCTWFFGYNKQSNKIFLAHFSDTDNIESSLRNIYFRIKESNNGNIGEFVSYFANPTIPSTRIYQLLSKDKELADFFGYPIDIWHISLWKLKNWQPSPWVWIDSRNWNIFIFAPEKTVYSK